MKPANSEKETLVDSVREKCPADKFRWSKMKLLTLEQALFLSYGIKPPDEQENPSKLVHYTRFLENDFLSVFKLSQNAVEARTLPVYDRFRVEAEDFVGWAKHHQIPIRTEFFYQPYLQDSQGEMENKKKVRREKPETIRKKMVRLGADLFWRREEKEQEASNFKEIKYTGPTQLAQKNEMKALVKIINELGGLSPIESGETRESGVDPEWISDLYPGKYKPGPRAKKRK